MGSLLRLSSAPQALRALARSEPRITASRVTVQRQRRSQLLVQARPPSRRLLHSSSILSQKGVPDYPPPTDFEELNVLGDAPVPSTSVDICMSHGFQLNSGKKILDGNGVLLIGGEAFVWRPWVAKETKTLVNGKGQLQLPAEAFGLLGLLWPRPDLLILGVGPQMRPISPETRRAIADLGMRVEVLDTRNAAAQFNLLATERGVNEVAAALIPLGWKDGIGAS